MKYIVGLKINKIPRPEDFDSEYNDNIIDEYVFCIKDLETGEKEEIHIVVEHGMCYSGYTTAEWIRSDIVKVKDFGSIHYVPKEKFPLHYNYEHEIPMDDNNLYEAYIGNDEYYPSAQFNIKFDGWIDTNRRKTSKPLWIFKGDSASGKSFIGSKINDLTVKELEEWEDLYLIDYDNIDVIILGNKNGINFETVVEAAEKNIKRETILVNFSKI